MKQKTFKLDGNTYKWIPVQSFDISKVSFSDDVFQAGYIKIACAFDIETTSYFSLKYDKYVACMYVWQLSLDKYTIMGRTWAELVTLLDKLSDYIEERNATLLCMVHNLSFEFQFLKGILNWNIKESTGYPDIFAKDDRTILYAKYKNIEFRDTLALTGMGLARLQKNYGLDIGKLKGDLDYSLLRHSESPISNRERAYCINDVQVLSDFFYKYLVPEYLSKGDKIPLTMTGEVRVDIKREFNELPKDVKKRLRNRIRRAQPSETVYKFWRNYLFRGGLVHAATSLCNAILTSAPDESIESYDLKSAHPSHMIQDPFPWKFDKRNPKMFDEVLEQARSGKYAFWGTFIFYNIQCSGFHSLESKNKVIDASADAVYENGRLVYASRVKVALTDLDWFNYEDLYEWDAYEVKVLYQSKYEPLPDYILKPLCKFFVIKESLEDGPDRNRAKRRLNSIFGMMATSLPERELVFDEELNTFKLSDEEKTYEELIQYLILLPQWSIWTAARTRRDIVMSIAGTSSVEGIGADSVYYDTDSNKILNAEEHRNFFEAFNEMKKEKNRKMNIFGEDPKYFERLGCFEKEYTIDRGKFLGAKRYLVTHDGKTQVTIAGCVKGKFEEYTEKLYRKEKNIDIDTSLTSDQEEELDKLRYNFFTDDMMIPATDSGKTTVAYTDKPIDDVLTDYEGNSAEIHEESCVAIFQIPFTMSVEADFIARIEEMSKLRERMIYKGVL